MLVRMRWVLFAMLAACGPVAYVSQTTMQAASAVEEARAAGADRYSPYWWTRATQYLHMSREVAAHADFQGANRFGRDDRTPEASPRVRVTASDRTTTLFRRKSFDAGIENQHATAPYQELVPPPR